VKTYVEFTLREEIDGRGRRGYEECTMGKFTGGGGLQGVYGGGKYGLRL